MEGRIVTPQQAQELEGIFFDANTYLGFVQDINDVYFLFLSSSDEVDIAPTEYAYLLDIPLSPYVPKITPTPLD
jgi:hypothetical protein